MNLFASPAPNPSLGQGTTGAIGNREIHPARARTNADDRGRFERLMNEKSTTDEDSDDAVADSSHDNGASSADTPDVCGGCDVLFGFVTPKKALTPNSRLGGLETAGASASAAAASASVQAAMNASGDAVQGVGPQPDETFEVSVQERLGIAVDVQATRPQTSGARVEKSGWMLTISSPVMDASVLARHVPRLNERLQARGATHSHIRIEEATEQSDERDEDSH